MRREVTCVAYRTGPCGGSDGAVNGRKVREHRLLVMRSHSSQFQAIAQGPTLQIKGNHMASSIAGGKRQQRLPTTCFERANVHRFASF